MPKDIQPDFKMQDHEFQDLRDQVDSVKQSDVKLGKVLESIIFHLGHLHGFDPVQEDEKKRKVAEEEQTQPIVPVQENKQAQKGEYHAI